MEENAQGRGKVITFYSYKGGTGRSMAVASVACLMGRQVTETLGKILVMDWDLEAPGLHRFFATRSSVVEHEDRPGVIDYFQRLRDQLSENQNLCRALAGNDAAKTLEEIFPLDQFRYNDMVPAL